MTISASWLSLTVSPEAGKTWNEEAFCPWICLKIVFRTWVWLRGPTVVIHLPSKIPPSSVKERCRCKCKIFQLHTHNLKLPSKSLFFLKCFIIYWYIYCTFYQLKSHLMIKIKICFKLMTLRGKKHIFLLPFPLTGLFPVWHDSPCKHGEPIKCPPVNPNWLSFIKAPYYLWVVAISPIICRLSLDRPLMVMVGLTPRPC